MAQVLKGYNTFYRAKPGEVTNYCLSRVAHTDAHLTHTVGCMALLSGGEFSSRSDGTER